MITRAADPTVENSPPVSWTEAVTLDEHCQFLLKRLGWPGREGEHAIRTLGLTSCRDGEGVSTVATYLATAAAARQGGRVVLVDANLDQPAVTQVFGVPNSPGLVECVIDDEPVSDALHPTTMENLHVLSSRQASWQPGAGV